MSDFFKWKKPQYYIAFSYLRWVNETANNIKVCPLVGLKLIDADRKWKAEIHDEVFF